MKVLRFDPEVGRVIQAFESRGFVLTALARLASSARISCAHLGPDGKIGQHPAASEQLMLVVEGDGVVRGQSGEAVAIRHGEAAFWERGELHETSTAHGLTAILIEAESLDASVFALRKP